MGYVICWCGLLAYDGGRLQLGGRDFLWDGWDLSGGWCGYGGYGRRLLLDGEVINYCLDACDLGGVCGGLGASGVTTDTAAESGDPVLNRGLNGFGADGTVSG